MLAESLKRKIEKKELQLNALLEITKTINNNIPEDKLYKIFMFTLRSNLNITRLVLFTHQEGQWICQANYGTDIDVCDLVPDDVFMRDNEPKKVDASETKAFAEFDLALPVFHKDEILALVFIGGLDEIKDHHEYEEVVKFVQTLSNVVIVAIENKKLARQQLDQEALRKELEIAREVQKFLFPQHLPSNSKLKIEATYLPHDQIGGDYYDYIPIAPHQFFICVADVSGKGIPAALMMSNFQASLRTLIRKNQSLTEIVTSLNYHVLENTKGEKFITFFCALYDMNASTLRYINSGHIPPFLLTGHKVRQLNKGSTVLGAMDPLPSIVEGKISDLRNFTLFCYTDGLTETVNEQDQEYSPQLVNDYLERNRNTDLKTIHQDIIIDLDTFKGNQGYKDDITLLSCRVSQE